jgi:hypothetical protein
VALGSDSGQDPNLATLTNSAGLGARFNGDRCSVCHQQPAIGGSGGFLVPNPQDPSNHFRKPENPMFDLIPHRKGGQNVALRWDGADQQRIFNISMSGLSAGNT